MKTLLFLSLLAVALPAQSINIDNPIGGDTMVVDGTNGYTWTGDSTGCTNAPLIESIEDEFGNDVTDDFTLSHDGT